MITIALTPPQFKRLVEWYYKGSKKRVEISSIATRDLESSLTIYTVVTIFFTDGNFDRLDLSTLVGLFEEKMIKEANIKHIHYTFEWSRKKAVIVDYIGERPFTGQHTNALNARLIAIYNYITSKEK